VKPPPASKSNCPPAVPRGRRGTARGGGAGTVRGETNRRGVDLAAENCIKAGCEGLSVGASGIWALDEQRKIMKRLARDGKALRDWGGIGVTFE